MSFVWPTSHVGMLHPLAAAGSNAHTQGLSFLQMAEAASQGQSYEQAKARFPKVDTSTVETRKSLYEEFGLLYVPKYSDTIHLTSVGRQLLELLGTTPPTEPSPELRRQVDSLLCWAMTHTQINRPQSLGSPAITPQERANCDIRPYAAFWQAMFALGGTIELQEFSNVLARVQKVAEFPAAIETILKARKTGQTTTATEQSGNFRIYWTSHVSVADAVLQVSDGRFTFAPDRQSMLKSVLQFQMGCEGNDASAAIRATPWKDVVEYYDFAGQQCPEFIASGQATVVSFGGQSVVMLKGYALQKDASGYFVDADMELCALKLGMPCFHSSEVRRMLRIDQKQTRAGNAVRIRFGLGRPINNPSQLLQLWGEE
jgi:hypothetical protein